MDYTSLTASKKVDGSIRNWVNSDKVPSDEIIVDAENWLNQNFRVVDMETRYPFMVSSGVSEYDLTANVPDFQDPILLWMNGYGEIGSIPEFDIDSARNADEDGSLQSGPPNCYATIGRKTILFDMEADRTYSFVLTYYGRPVALSAGNLTSLYTTHYPVLFRQVCLAMSYIFLKDERRADSLLQMAGAIMTKIAETDDLSRRGQHFDTRTHHG